MAADSELATYLATQSIGTVETDLFPGEIPAAVAAGVGLTMYTGAPPELTCGSLAITLEIARLQVTVRSTTEVLAQAKALATAQALAKIANQTLSGIYYRSVTVLQSPGLLYRDGNNRPVYGFNIEAEKEPS